MSKYQQSNNMYQAANSSQPFSPNNTQLSHQPNPFNNNNNSNPYSLPPDAANYPKFVPPQYSIPVNMDFRNSFAAETNSLIAKKSSLHCRSFFANFLLVGGLAGALVTYFVAGEQTLSMGATIGICVGSYLLYLILGCCCNELRQYLSNVSHGQHFDGEYNRVRGLIGVFVFHAECYHYQTRYHTRTVTENGQTRTQTYTTTEKVVTHTSTETITPSNTQDESGQADRINALSNIIFVHFKVKYRFTDDISRRRLDEAFYYFKMRNMRDSHQDFTMKYDVPGLIDRMTFFVGQLDCNFLSWFYSCGMVGCLWFYSLFVERKVDRFDMLFTKVVTI